MRRALGTCVRAFTSSTHIYVSVLGKDASPSDYPVRGLKGPYRYLPPANHALAIVGDLTENPRHGP
ncbi:hypothetical protein ELH91_25805 (plasmid) [Rhizobium leguminosarum]|nr:hypothetical protein ELI21_28640 [Rhizobium leguminosarum]TAV84495.1 hypothetical protein ELI22_27735 [Rhizobium leguminosarum]TAW26930.1 hypothetical protein ELI23_28685 [Rhizobium leguminosarum]TAX24698.1 hypothetical protein ELI04_27890 [Rhizobium leguminosarum]TAY08632.1 hypothetical protein ELH91_25805 [Rhizobium leguminosarum]